jgi:A/G-specific adenine glycosylase
VSEIMLQQTTVKAVVPYYERFLAAFPTLDALARARLPRVLAAWSGLGYYRRARHLHAAARLVARRHQGEVPRERDALLALPGIGRYTAGAILSIAWGAQEPVVDGNVARVLCRWLGERRDPGTREVSDRLWRAAAALVTATRSPGDLNEALMELGATLCTPVSPACGACPLKRDCRARALDLQERIPPPRRRREQVRLRRRVALVERDGRYLVRRRAPTGLMDGLWEFPELGQEGDQAIEPLEPLGSVRHLVTYRRYEVTVHRGRLTEPPPAGWRWVTPAGLRRLPTSSLVAKVLALHGGAKVVDRAARSPGRRSPAPRFKADRLPN